MSRILVERLSKSYRIAERAPGLWGALRGLIRRRYRTVHALHAVDFVIDEGELVGYIGPNGAGKSTTIKLLSGILVPSSGRCEVMGREPWKHRIATVGRIGAVFGQRTQLWWDLPVIESFDLLRDIYRVDAHAYRTTLDELVGRLGLEGLLDTPVRQLSLGQRMRCDLAAAVVYELLRPLDMYAFWYSRMLAVKLAPAILRAIPILVLAGVAGWIEWPAWPVIVAWLASMIAAALLGCALATAVAVSTFWTLSGQGVLQLTSAFGLLLSGLVIPLPLFPVWLQPFLQALPFRGLVDIPFRIFTGNLPLTELPSLLTHQLAWTVALILAGRYVTFRALRRVVVQGG